MTPIDERESTTGVDSDPFKANVWLEIFRYVKENEYFPKLKGKYARYHAQLDQANGHELAKLRLRFLIPCVLYSYVWNQFVRGMAAHLEKDYVDPVSCNLDTIPVYHFMFIRYISLYDYVSFGLSACVIFYSAVVLAYSVANIFKSRPEIWGLPVLQIGITLCLLRNLTPGLCFATNFLHCAGWQSLPMALQGDYSYWYYELNGKNTYLDVPYFSLFRTPATPFPAIMVALVVANIVNIALFFGLTDSRRDPPNRNNIINQWFIMILDGILQGLPFNLYQRFIDVFFRPLCRNALSLDELKQFKQDFDAAYIVAANSIPKFPNSPLAQIFPDPKLKFEKIISTKMMVTCRDGVTYNLRNLEEHIKNCVESHYPNAKCKEGVKPGSLFFKPFKNSLQIFSPIFRHICIAQIETAGSFSFKVPFTYNNFDLKHFESHGVDDEIKGLDPVTLEPFENPFVTVEGKSYNICELLAWYVVKKNKGEVEKGAFRDYITRNMIKKDELIPNLSLYRLMNVSIKKTNPWEIKLNPCPGLSSG